MKKKIILMQFGRFAGYFLWLALMSLVACSTQVKRVGVDTDIDLSGEWNDVDSRLVAEEITKDVLSRPLVCQIFRRYCQDAGCHSRRCA